MSDVMQRLTDVWAGVEQSTLWTVPVTSGAGVSNPCLPSSHKRTFWILIVSQISQNVSIKFKFTVKQDTPLRLSLVSWRLCFTSRVVFEAEASGGK